MSFQDVGRRPVGGGRGQQQQQEEAQYQQQQRFSAAASGSARNGYYRSGYDNNTSSPMSENGSDDYKDLSDGILQYQKNVNTLSGLVRNIGTRADGPVLETQLKVQVDALKELGTKIEQQLRKLEQQMATMSRTDGARARATHVKLSRDFRRVQETFQQLVLDGKAKRNIQDEKKKRQNEDEQRRRQQAAAAAAADAVNSQRLSHAEREMAQQLRAQLDGDRISEEILREREQEIRNINQGMSTVNEIYKDLAGIVSSQQEQIDTVEKNMESANENAHKGLEQVQKANKRAGDGNGGGQCVIS